MVDGTVGIPSPDQSEEQPLTPAIATLPVWHKPEVSRIAIATTTYASSSGPTDDT